MHASCAAAEVNCAWSLEKLREKALRRVSNRMMNSQMMRRKRKMMQGKRVEQRAGN